MKKILIAAGCLALSAGFIGCGGASGNDPGSSYAPDMYYSRAVEAYGYNNITENGIYDHLAKKGIHYNGLPVPGTVARGDMGSYYITRDSAGLMAAQGLKNPLDTLSNNPLGMKEAERLYQVNCGICHGQNLDGNGPLWNNGNGPYAAAPRNLKDDYTKALSDGHMFYVITHGIRTMGPYHSQLKPAERWWVISYIRQMQNGGSANGNAATGAAADTTGANGNNGAGAAPSMAQPTQMN
jgi:mono/diheme cytochrome c family protein